MLAAGTLTQHRNFTKSGERSQHDRTNLNQRDWAGDTSSNHYDRHKRLCVSWWLIWVGVGGEASEGRESLIMNRSPTLVMRRCNEYAFCVGLEALSE